MEEDVAAAKAAPKTVTVAKVPETGLERPPDTLKVVPVRIATNEGPDIPPPVDQLSENGTVNIVGSLVNIGGANPVIPPSPATEVLCGVSGMTGIPSSVATGGTSKVMIRP